MKKKALFLLLVLVLAITLISCSSSDAGELQEEIAILKETIKELEKENKELTEQIESQPSTPEPTQVSELGIDEWWEVPGQWRLKIDSVTITEDRNQYSDKEPAEVVIIKYTYENTGYESDSQDLFMSPDNIIDGSGEMGYSYPASTTTSPKPTPIGAKCVGAEDAQGYDNESDTLKILFSKFDNDSNKQKMTFNVPVTK